MKSKFRKTQKKTRKIRQKGGIMIDSPNHEGAFNYFIQKSNNFELLTDSGTFGIVFKASIDKNTKSPYRSFQPDDFGQPVRTLLIKIVALSKEKMDEDDDVWSYLNDRTKHIGLQEDFKKEVNIQTDVFFKTMNYLEPICPAPVFSKIYEGDLQMNTFFDQFQRKTLNSYTKKVLDKIMENIYNDRIPSIGILAMEIADGFTTMAKLYETCAKKSSTSTHDSSYFEFYEWCEQMAKLQILKLALQTGYSHNDFHRNNILINPSYTDYYYDVDGKVLLIDFGFATKLHRDDLDIIRSSYKDYEYSNALTLFGTLKRSDGVPIDFYPKIYGWLYNDKEAFRGIKLIQKPNIEYDKKIHELIEREEMAIDERVAKFDKLYHRNHESDSSHESDSNRRIKYPRLPLGNSIKKSFYQGMIDI